MARFEVEISTNKIGSLQTREFTIDDQYLEGMSDHERTQFIEAEAEEVMYEMLYWTWKEVQ